MRQSLSESMDGAARMAGEIGMYLRTDRGEMALLRISDLMNQVAYLNGRWQDRLPKRSRDNLFRAHGQLRSMHQLLNAARDTGPEDNARLATFCQEVNEIFSMEQGVATQGYRVGGRLMVDEKLIKFFEGVLSKTREGRIPWEATAQESNFIAPIGGEFQLSISGPTELDSLFTMTQVLAGSSRSHAKIRVGSARHARYDRHLSQTATKASAGCHAGAVRGGKVASRAWRGENQQGDRSGEQPIASPPRCHT